MAKLLERVRHATSRFGRDRSGGTLVTFALVGAALVGGTGAAVDYANISTQKRGLQAAADAAAINAAREFRLGNADAATIALVARTYAQAALTNVKVQSSVQPSVDMTLKTVTVRITADIPTYFMKMFAANAAVADVKATARVVGGSPICVIGLNQKQSNTIQLTESARLEAPGCAVYSDSSDKKGLVAQDGSVLKAAFICSSGGNEKAGPGSFSPTPQSDCPVIPDPLASRPTPPTSGCDFNKKEVKDTTSVTLNPGVYCGGLTIKDWATVKLNPGIYVMKDGKLKVTDKATMTGVNVGFYFTGDGSIIDFNDKATISLTAPKTGVMSGILFFEDRSVSVGNKHQIDADNARVLLGTIYLSRGQLNISSNAPVADQSAYTIVVTNRFTLGMGPTMVLNTGYDKTDIPVPDGVGPNGNKTFLTN